MEKSDKILIVEDESIVALNLQSRLEKMGYEVSGVASSGEAAIAAAQANQPDLVLMDIRIKGKIDGIETANIIRAKFNIPVIYLTAYVDQETLERAKITEPYGYLIKPIEAKELSSNIQISLYKHRTERRLKESEEKFREIFHQAFNFIWLLKPDGTVLDSNQTVLEFTEIALSDIVGHPFWQGKWWRFSTTNEASLQTAITQAANGERVCSEVNIISRDQQIITLDLSIKPVMVENQVTLLIAEGKDISERKQAAAALKELNEGLESQVQHRTRQLEKIINKLEAEITERKSTEKALRESDARFQKLVANVPGVIYQYVLHSDGSDSFTYVSPQSRDILEIEPEKMLEDSQVMWNIIHSEDREYYQEATMLSARDLQPWRWEGRIITASGNLKWVQGISQPEKQENGEILWDGLMIDVSDRKEAESALYRSESRLRLALNAGEMGTWDWDIGSQKVTWSGQTEVIFGFDSGSFTGTYEAFLNCVHPADRQHLIQTLNHTLQERTPYIIEHRVLRADGSLHWVAGFGYIICNLTGEPTGMSGVVMDITERKQAEDALRDSEFKLRTIIENSNDAITLKDTEGRYLLINPAGAKFLGRSVSEVIGKRDQELFTPETGEKIWQFDQTVMQSGITWTYEEVAESDGCKRTYLSTKCPYFSPQGELTGIIGVCRDITASKIAEETMKRQLAAVEAAGDGIAILNSFGEYIYLNQSHVKIFGYDSCHELIGKNWRDLYHREEVERLETEVFSLLLKTGSWQGEATAKKRDGTTFFQEISLTLIPDGGMISVCRDITERKRVEEILLLRDRAIAASNNGIIISDATLPHFPVIYVNPAFEEITGYTAEEVIGKNCRFLQRNDINQPGLKIVRSALKEGKDCTVVVRNYRKDGTLFWNEFSLSPIYDGDGKLTHYIGIQIDITERKQAEEELRATTSRLSALIENLQLGVLVKNEDQQVVLINQAFCDMLNIPIVAPALIGADFSDFADEYKHFFADSEQFVERHNQIVQARKIITNEEIQMVNGKTFERDYVPILVQGKYSGYLWMYRDITKRKQAEASLQEAKDQLQAVLDAVPGFVSWISSDLRYIGVNRHLAASFNFSPEDFVGQEVGFMESSAEFAEYMGQFLASSMLSSSQVIDVKINGLLRNYLIIAQKYQQGTTAVSVGIDITERKQVESELRTSLKEKEVLLKEIHHRVKNNLQVISSLLKLQSAYIKDKEALALFTDSYNRVRSMALIHEKLYQSSSLGRINAAEYIRDLVDHLFRSYRVATIPIELNLQVEEISLDVDTAIPCGLIINELVSNSLKYGFTGRSKGGIIIKFAQTEAQKINLVVGDDGVGLPPEFDVEETESLGLNLVYNLTEQLGGELKLNCESGTLFDITFTQLSREEKK